MFEKPTSEWSDYKTRIQMFEFYNLVTASIHIVSKGLPLYKARIKYSISSVYEGNMQIAL
jgi:hypothetical protein